MDDSNGRRPSPVGEWCRTGAIRKVMLHSNRDIGVFANHSTLVIALPYDRQLSFGIAYVRRFKMVGLQHFSNNRVIFQPKSKFSFLSILSHKFR